jgi:hypothetical protein
VDSTIFDLQIHLLTFGSVCPGMVVQFAPEFSDLDLISAMIIISESLICTSLSVIPGSCNRA